MNKDLSIILRDRIAVLPFIDLVSGMVETRVKVDVTEAGKVTAKFPVSTTALRAECTGREVSMVPDYSRKSVAYFEDYGISQPQRTFATTEMSSRIRCVVWLNRAKFAGDIYAQISGRAMALVIAALEAGGGFVNVGIFQKLQVSVTGIPAQDQAIFGKYSYSEPDTQYLMPPAEYFALDLTCKFRVSHECAGPVPNDPAVCP